jgi:hypothetical protein
MPEARSSWRPLGALLVDKGLLTESQLSAALAEQRRSGRLVGQILVESGVLSALSLGRALSEQHGVELQTVPGDKPEATTAQTPAVWRPLGKLLVEEGYLTKDELRQALARQLESRGRRLLGEILVAEGFLSGIELARALTKQSGVLLEPRDDQPVETVLRTAAAERFVYQVYEVSYEPDHKAHNVLYESASFLEAVDYAAEYLEDADPDGLEIGRIGGAARETVWTYSASRAAATAASKRDLAETFGFDPTLWGSAPA